MMQLLHNPRCGKSRDCLAFLSDSHQKFEIINYLEKPLSKDELKSLIKKLKMKPIELVRQKETIWIEKFKDKKLTDAVIINAMVKYPILIQRPIVIKDDVAIIGRDIENLESFLQNL